MIPNEVLGRVVCMFPDDNTESSFRTVRPNITVREFKPGLSFSGSQLDLSL